MARVVVYESQGTITLPGPGRQPVLEKFWSEIELSDGTVLTTCQSGFTARHGKWSCSLANGRLTLEVSFEACGSPRGWLIHAALKNSGWEPLPVRQVRLVRAASGGGPGSIPGGNPRVLKFGYTFGGAHREDADDRCSALAPLGDARETAKSWEQVAMCDTAGPGGLLMGFVTSARQLGWFEIRGECAGADISAVCDTEGAAFEPRTRMVLETLFVGRPESLAEGLADLAKLRARAMRVVLKPVPSGWCSWHCMGKAGVSEAGVLENARFIAGHRRELALDVVQVDDGHASAYGDWLDTVRRFPKGLKWLAGEIKRLRLTPGIWLAPFVAQASSKLFKEHPDWMVADASGRPLAWEVEWAEPREPWFALDGSHPEVRRWLSGLFRTLRGWGYTYFKLDFLFMGCLRGKRAGAMTRAAAMREGLRAIREGARDAYIMACTTPYGPCTGLVDGVRVSHDVQPQALWNSHREAARETRQRLWGHRILWNADPDAIILGEIEGVDSETSRAVAAGVLVSGGAFFSGDRLAALGPERLSLLSSLSRMPRSSAGFVPDLLEEEYPRLVARPFGRGRILLGVFNDSDVPRTCTVELARLGLGTADLGVLVSGGVTPLGRARTRFVTPPVPPRGAIVFVVSGR